MHCWPMTTIYIAHAVSRNDCSRDTRSRWTDCARKKKEEGWWRRRLEVEKAEMLKWHSGACKKESGRDTLTSQVTVWERESLHQQQLHYHRQESQSHAATPGLSQMNRHALLTEQCEEPATQQDREAWWRGRGASLPPDSLWESTSPPAAVRRALPPPRSLRQTRGRELLRLCAGQRAPADSPSLATATAAAAGVVGALALQTIAEPTGTAAEQGAPTPKLFIYPGMKAAFTAPA